MLNIHYNVFVLSFFVSLQSNNKTDRNYESSNSNF